MTAFADRKETLGRGQVAVLTEHHVDQGAVTIEAPAVPVQSALKPLFAISWLQQVWSRGVNDLVAETLRELERCDADFGERRRRYGSVALFHGPNVT